MDEDLLVNNNDIINTVVNILFIRVYFSILQIGTAIP